MKEGSKRKEGKKDERRRHGLFAPTSGKKKKKEKIVGECMARGSLKKA